MENPCKSCPRPCCTGCKQWIDGVCTSYDTRPKQCMTFPWFFNPYKGELDVLTTCPRWKEFKEAGCPDPEFVLEFTKEKIANL